MKKLGEEGTECAARHNDGAFRAKRSAGTNGNGRRDRLQQRHFRLNLGAAQQDGLDRLRNAMAADAV